MAKMTVKGLREVENMLDTIASSSGEIASKGLYDGAGVVADAVKSAVDTIPVSNTYGTEDVKKRGISADERMGLKEAVGIAPHQESGAKVHTSVGFDGYVGNTTRKYPKGKPAAMIARSVERGTSFMYATPFVKPTVQKCRRTAQAAIEKTVREEIQKKQK